MQVVLTDNKYGALECHACIKCAEGYYSNKETTFKCIPCNTHCSDLFKETIQKCNGRRVNVCGTCLEGYYNPYPHSQSFPCRPKDVKTGSKMKILSTPPSDYGSPNNTVDLTTSSGKSKIETPGHTNHLKLTTVILILVLAALCLAVLVLVIWVIHKCLQVQDPGTSTNNFSSISSGQSLLGLKETEKPTNEKLETDGINEWHKENIEKMANIYLEASDQYVRYVSSHIDKDPDDFFEELKVRNDIIFQANYHKEEHGYPEYVITVLNAWITKQEQLVSLFTLYSALNIRHYDNLCSGLANLLR